MENEALNAESHGVVVIVFVRDHLFDLPYQLVGSNSAAVMGPIAFLSVQSFGRVSAGSFSETTACNRA